MSSPPVLSILEAVFNDDLDPAEVFHPEEMPRCAVCGRAVDRVTIDESYLSRHAVIRAYCHGEVEEVVLTQLQIEANRGRLTIAGAAFAPKQLPAATAAHADDDTGALGAVLPPRDRPGSG